MSTSRRIDLRNEDGIAIVVAVILLAFMLILGLAAASFVDGQSNLTGKQRQRETAFNVAEAALNAQITQIGHHWAGKNAETIPSIAFTQCPGGTYCPADGELKALVPSADTKVPIAWKTNVYDNSGGLAAHFADSRIAGQCGCDANKDQKVWVRAEATVRGHKRVIVSLVQEQFQAESVPHAALISGSLTIRNNGLHSGAIIESGTGVVAVRCTVAPPENSSQECLGQPLGKPPTQNPDDWNNLLSNQISGWAGAVQGYDPEPVFSQDQVDRFINTARAESTYYTSCPASLAGQVVVVNTTGTCSYTGSDEWNTQADPGFLIFLNSNSALSLGGTTTYNGVIYHANSGQTDPLALGSDPQSTGSLIITGGNTLIRGGVIIDGPGRMEAGESGMNIQFDDHGYDAVKSLAAAAIVQNSWRELQPGA
jgi:Tfp pilus assembly protein PilX